MPPQLAATRIATEQQAIADIDRQLEGLEGELREALLPMTAPTRLQR